MTGHGIWSLLGGEGGNGGLSSASLDVSPPTPGLKCPSPARRARLVALPSPRCCPWLLELLRLHLWPELPFVFTWLILHYPLKISLVRRSFRKPFLPLSHRPLVKAAPGARILLPGRSAHCSTTDPTTLLRVAPEVRLPPHPSTFKLRGEGERPIHLLFPVSQDSRFFSMFAD